MTKNDSSRSLIPTRGIAALSASAAVLLLSSCAYIRPPDQDRTAMSQKPVQRSTRPVAPPKQPAKPDPLYEWNGDGRTISHIEISVDEQKARFYDGNEEIGWTTVASGVRKHPTPVGTFAVLEKATMKKSNLYGRIYNKNGKVVVRDAKLGRDPIPPGGRFEGAKMPYFLRLTGDGIAMHAGPIPHPGRRASHGCIRMPGAFASILFRQVGVGTSVQVQGNGPSYATYIAQGRAAATKAAAARAAKAKAPAERTTNGVATEQPEAPTQNRELASSPPPVDATATARAPSPAPADAGVLAAPAAPALPASPVSEIPKPDSSLPEPQLAPAANPEAAESSPKAASRTPPPRQREG
jgi:hypothetical protein